MKVIPDKVIPDVVEEHAEEASFLYDQRAYLRRTGQAEWPRLERIERRIEAHVEALVVAGSAGAWAVVERVRLEPGAVFAAGLRAAYADQPEALADAAAAATRDSGQRVLVHALVHGAPASWGPVWRSALAGDGPVSVRTAAAVAGRSGLALGPDLVDALDRADDAPTRAALIEALGRLRYAPALGALLHRHLADPEPAVSQAALLALLLLGVPRARAVCAARAEAGGVAALALAASGTRADGETLAAAARAGAPRAALALGLHGDPAHLGVLLDAVEAAQPDAEWGLFLLMGNPVPAPSGEGWRDEWERRGAQLAPGTRHRLGVPFAAADAARVLASGAPDEVRQWVGWELAARYGTGVLDPRDFVRRQRGALAAAAAVLGAAPGGAWSRG